MQNKDNNIMKLIITTFLSLLITCFTYSQERTRIKITTIHGNMIAELYNETPQHRDNFIKLIKEGFYEGTLFHRVIPRFMIQGGDPNSRDKKPKEKLGNGGPGYTIPSEIRRKFFHKKGAIAAARMPDGVNPNKESSGSQFYIVDGAAVDKKSLDMYSERHGINFTDKQKEAYLKLGGAPHLDGGYTVFGEVIEGLEVISRISNAKRDNNNLPIERISISISIIN